MDLSGGYAVGETIISLVWLSKENALLLVNIVWTEFIHAES